MLTLISERITIPEVIPGPCTSTKYSEFRKGIKYVFLSPLLNNQVYYMGTTGGGVWKTVNAGQAWYNISDSFFTTGSIGAVAVSEADPNVVFVGTGEHAPRGVMTSYGDGVYKSTDAGRTWKKMGLELTRHISGIAIHPKNPDIVYVAAQGALHGPSMERGMYKSVDGGVTWNKILYIDQNTGCSEISLDMNNPRVIYASMWDHRRLPWEVRSGGPGSGVYKSEDEGRSWKTATSSSHFSPYLLPLNGKPTTPGPFHSSNYH
jgi:photosystem II stability/assembly factor-like uncharacterized protein